MTMTTCVRGIALGLTAIVLLPGVGRAQGTRPVPLSQVVLSDAAAEKAGMKQQINVKTARAIVDACVAFAKAHNASYAIAVMGPTGEMIQSHVMDGQLPIGIETSRMKAETALYSRLPSRDIASRYQGNLQSYLQRAHLGADAGLSYYPVAGGLPIRVDGFLIGAIGVGGGYSTAPGAQSPSDEACAHHALTQVLGPQPPLPATGAGRGGRTEGAGGRAGGRGAN